MQCYKKIKMFFSSKFKLKFCPKNIKAVVLLGLGEANRKALQRVDPELARKLSAQHLLRAWPLLHPGIPLHPLHFFVAYGDQFLVS
jgi:hypothetical protein